MPRHALSSEFEDRGLMETAKVFTGDMNTLQVNGFYYANGSDNRPAPWNGYVEVIKYADGYVSQRYTTYQGDIYTRVMDNSVWKSWSQLGTQDKIDVLSGIGVFIKKDGTSDDSTAFQSALNEAQSKKSPIIFPATSSSYIINSDIVVPNGIHLISNGATIKLRGLLTLSGGNKVSGFTFDGEWSSKGVKITGAGCKILFNTFKNMKASVSGQTNVLNFSDTIGDALIFGNEFDGIKPYQENSIGGDDVGVARAIRTKDGENIVIENNTFKNMEGYEDGDYVQISSSVISGATYPFQGSLGGYFKKLFGVKIVGNTFYQTLNKSSVKIQASGVTISDNEFILDFNGTGGSMYSVVRANYTKGLTIKNNKFTSKGTKLVYMILVEYSDKPLIKENEIYFEQPLTHEANFESRIFYFLNVKNLIKKKNIVQGKNVKEFIRLDGCKYPSINVNDYEYFSTDQTASLINLNNAETGIKNETVVFKGNIVICEDETKVLTTNFQQINNLFIEENIITPKISLSVTDVDGATIENNHIKNPNTYAVSVYNVCNNIQLIKNKFGTLNSFFRIYNAGTKIKCFDNIADSVTGVFNVGSSGQSFAELEYEKGNVAIIGYDNGYASARPATNKRIGYPYYDQTLGKVISWNGTEWIDSTSRKVWTPNKAYVLNDIVNTGVNQYQSTVAGTTGTTMPSHTTGTATDGTVTWTFVKTIA